MGRRVLLTCVLLMCGCGHQLTSGEIVKKNYYSPRDWIWVMFIPITSGKTVLMLPESIPMHDPASYSVIVKGTPDGKDKVIQEEWFICKEWWDKVRVGDTFTKQMTQCSLERVHNRKDTGEITDCGGCQEK